MILKEFRAKTESDAIEAAKKALGDNIVIMHTRSVKRKGISSWFFPPMIEITVGREEENDKQTVAKAVSKETERNITEALGKIGPIVAKAESEGKLDTRLPRKDSVEEKLDNIQNLIEGKLNTAEEKKETKVKEEPVAAVAPSVSEDKKTELDVFFELLKSTMLENEIDEEYAGQIVDETAKTTKDGTPIDAVLANVYQKMILKFGKSSTITPADKGPKTVFFIGPTGVGKTTTIAKIASMFSVVNKKKVALLTADTYRIAAAEQLRTYASILDVPFRIIYTKEEMENALSDYKDFDYIFVDTAGHSHQNNEQKDIMAEFIHCVDGLTEKEIYLVLSATTKYRDLKSIADVYSKITDYKLIFTKLDETTALGNLLNLKLHTGASLSYITCGQNVPDDIEDFNAQSTVKYLLGGKR